MPFPFDATLKEIVEDHAVDFVPVFGLPTNLPPHPLNIDLSTVSAATDVGLGFGNPVQEIVDLNFQSGPDPFLDGRIHLYNSIWYHHYHVPVRTIAILLRPGADHQRLTGRLAYGSGRTRVDFQYELVRMWQMPATQFLNGGLGLLPLATLCELPADVPIEHSLTDLVQRITQRLRSGVPHAEAAQLLTATFVLSGLRVERSALAAVFRGVGLMEESSGVQLLMEEGAIRRSHRWLLLQGTKRLGAPELSVEPALKLVRDLDRLDRMAGAVMTVNSWQELLDTP